MQTLVEAVEIDSRRGNAFFVRIAGDSRFTTHDSRCATHPRFTTHDSRFTFSFGPVS